MTNLVALDGFESSLKFQISILLIGGHGYPSHSHTFSVWTLYILYGESGTSDCT